jgi:hypothetical protein
MPPVHRAAVHERTIEMLFAHPLSRNIEWRDVVHLLQSIGTTTEGGHDTLHATVNGQTVILHGTEHKALRAEQVMQLRHFLRAAGVEVPGGAEPRPS